MIGFRHFQRTYCWEVALQIVRPPECIPGTIIRNFKVLTLLASALAANAATMIFDNGTPDVTSSSSRGITIFRSADDFTLANAANVSSVRFWMVDQPGNFSGSITYAFYQNSAGALGSLISSATVSGITPFFLN